jgi:RNA polymerase sigma-70 factor (ECF subfamily)
MSSENKISEAVLQRLLARRREFLAFVERRVGDRAVAEDLLQDAFVRSLEKGDELRDEESARAWFYRMLRNAVIDRHRRQDAAARTLSAFAVALENESGEAARELDRVACRCIGDLLANLPESQASILRRVELDGARVVDVAAETGISESAAGVRVFRARRALRQEVTRCCGACADHGCLDCSCKHPR